MKNKYKLGMYEKASPDELSWSERFKAVRSAGYDYMELSIDESDKRLSRLDWSEKEIRDLAALAKDEGIFLGSICFSAQRKYPFGLPSDKPMELMEKCLSFAATAGIPIIQLAGYDVYYEEGTKETERRFASKLVEAAHLAAQYGVILAFETMETPFMDTVGKAMKYVKEVDSPYLQVYPDIGNLNNAALLYGTSVIDDLETGRGHIVATHIKETEPGKYRNMLFGQGRVDFRSDLEKTYALGIRRYVTEMWYLGTPSWQDDLKAAVGFARSILDSLPNNSYLSSFTHPSITEG